MNNISEFMLEEYKQIANAYQDLHTQHNELIKTYLTLVAFPATILAVALEIVKQLQLPADPSKLDSIINSLSFPIILVLLIALFFIGITVLSAYVSTRAEAILYIRTVNCVRRYFIDHSSEADVKKYLVLPDYDSFPPFVEDKFTRSFWNTMVILIINSVIFGVISFSLLIVCGLKKDGWLLWVLSSIMITLAFISQYQWQKRILSENEKRYRVKFRDSSQNKNQIGIDLDGVLGDLVHNVIKYSKEKFNIRIKSEEITTHDLTKCTKLSDSQVKELFQDTEIFSTLNVLKGSKESIQILKARGYTIHIVSDRFWDKDDWKNTKKWLDGNEFSYDSLCLVSANDKLEYAKKHKLEYFIEDNLETAKKLSTYCKNVFLFNTPYNQGDIPPSVRRFNHWYEIIEILFNN
jgi:uncharacterized protein